MHVDLSKKKPRPDPNTVLQPALISSSGIPQMNPGSCLQGCHCSPIPTNISDIQDEVRGIQHLCAFEEAGLLCDSHSPAANASDCRLQR
ncbi:UNVERIFIED_CONTAM: hypothetical protein FKN15_045938 [Acipenser sinensis]